MNKLLSGRHVLVAEDEMMILMIIEDMLADLGCESVTAGRHTVDQVLALIDAQVFDAAMLDTNLNGNKSHAVADALVARGVPFVFSTGYSGLDVSDGYGDRPVLKKPFPYEELVEDTYTSSSTVIWISHCDQPLPAFRYIVGAGGRGDADGSNEKLAARRSYLVASPRRRLEGAVPPPRTQTSIPLISGPP